jgi:hypothetical protein
MCCVIFNVYYLKRIRKVGKTRRREVDVFKSGKKKKALRKKIDEQKDKKYRKTFKDYIKE